MLAAMSVDGTSAMVIVRRVRAHQMNVSSLESREVEAVGAAAAAQAQRVIDSVRSQALAPLHHAQGHLWAGGPVGQSPWLIMVLPRKLMHGEQDH